MADTADLDLAGVKLTELTVRANSSLVKITLPLDAGLTTVALESKAAAVTVRIPDGVTAWIRGERDIPELSLDVTRFPIVVGFREYRSTDYDTATNRVELTASASAGSISIV